MNGPRILWNQVITDGDMSGALSATLKTEALDKLTVAVTWASGNTVNGSLVIEGSVDGSTWFDVGVTEPTITGASGSGFVIVTDSALCWPQVRVRWAENTTVAGTLQVWVFGKSS